MDLKQIYKINGDSSCPVISYEVFPPKDDEDKKKMTALFQELEILKKYSPALISVTYGAGGSNQNESLEIIKKIKDDLNTTPMPHFTCVSTTEANIKKYLKTIEEIGIKNILALRGDVPENGDICHDFQYASELVSCIKAQSNLSVAVAGYPEGHKEAESIEKDIVYLKNKVEKGADVIYTQLFFNNHHLFSFIEKCEKVGISIPVIPGILPVTSYKQLEKMTSLCKVDVPKLFLNKLDLHKDDKDYIKKCGIEYAIYQCEELLDNGIIGLHFYTLNKSYATSEILNNILN